MPIKDNSCDISERGKTAYIQMRLNRRLNLKSNRLMESNLE